MGIWNFIFFPPSFSLVNRMHASFHVRKFCCRKSSKWLSFLHYIRMVKKICVWKKKE
jgi:hypothetical protein